MTTSSRYYYQLTRDEIATAALRKLGVIAEGQTPSAQNLADAQVALNSTIAEFRTKGMSLWARSEYTFTPTTNVYTIGEGMTLNTPFPVKLLQAFRLDSSNAKVPMELVAREDFNILPVNSNGIPIKVNYQPFINYGTVSIWPTPDSTNTATITLVYQRPFQYFTSGTETLDFPEEWYNAIIYKIFDKYFVSLFYYRQYPAQLFIKFLQPFSERLIIGCNISMPNYISIFVKF